MTDRIKNCDLPLYFYGLYVKYKDDPDYQHYIQDKKALCLPLLNEDGEARGFIAYDLYDGFIRQPLDYTLRKDHKYKELNDFCMMPKGEDGFLYFDKDRCVNKLNDFFMEIDDSVSVEEIDEDTEETEDTMDIINNIFGE